jgi:peptide deformylase
MSLDTSTLQIVHFPDPVLRAKAEPIESITDEVRAVAERMIQLMREVNGAGLAAPQVGLSWRMFVVASRDDDEPDQVFINPQLEVLSRDLVPHEEGCLSLPGISADVRRPSTIRMSALNLDNEQVILESDDYPARVWQHEFDHLEGVLIIDRMSPMDRLANRKAIKELKANA